MLQPPAARLPLPSPWQLAAAMPLAAGGRTGRLAAALTGAQRALAAASARGSAHHLGRAQRQLGGLQAPLAEVPADTGTPLARAEVLDFDQRFAVQRHQAADGAGLAELLALGLLQGLQTVAWLASRQPGLDATGLAQQRQGLACQAALLARCSGLGAAALMPLARSSVAAAKSPSTVSAGTGPAPDDDPATAWALWQGFHWLFFINVQGLTLALLRFEAALACGHLPAATLELEAAAQLLQASGAAMRLAAGFSPQAYATTVRPAMMPPQVESDRFSGLMAWDHARLVRLWQQLRPRFAALPAALQPAHQGFVAAYRLMMQAHHGVCARFGGEQGQSLRARTSSHAVDTLARMGQLRLALIDPGAGAEAGR